MKSRNCWREKLDCYAHGRNLPIMKATSGKSDAAESALCETTSELRGITEGGIDLGLLKDSLAKTPWERMQANDDALNFAESLRTAMQKRHAKS